MTDEDRLDRRRFLQGAGAIGLLGLAGCLGDDDDSDDEDDDDTADDDEPAPDTVEERLYTDTNLIYPGAFTEFPGGVFVGAHPYAITEPIEVEVEVYDAELGDELDFPTERMPTVDEFVDITVKSIDDPWILPPSDTGFYVGLPVPDEFNEDHLEPVEFAPGEHADHISDDQWLRTTGRFDPEEACYFIDIEALGGTDFPTKLGLIEFDQWSTGPTDRVIENLLTEEFPRIENEHTRREWIREEAPARVDTSLELLSSVNFSDYEVSFSVEWKASGSEDSGFVSDQESALLDAIPEFRDLVGSPLPKLKTTWGSKFSSSEKIYQYYIHDAENNWVRSLGSGIRRSGCGNNAAGVYLIPGQYALTCYGAGNPERTTKHELFHAIQADWTRTGRDKWVNEGTARIAENLSLLDMRHSNRPLDFDLELAQDLDEADNITPEMEAPYRTELFWVDLLVRSGESDFSLLGRLFDEGRDTDAAESFISSRTPFSSIADAHWEWVKNAAVEGNEELDGAYTHQCSLNEDAFDGDIETMEVDIDEEFAQPGEPAPDSVTYTLNSVPKWTASVLEIEFSNLIDSHYFEVSFAGDEPRSSRLYPDEGNCLPDNPDWDYGTFNDLSNGNMAMVNRGTFPTYSGYLLMQGPFSSTTVEVSGPFEYGGIELQAPDSPVDHTYEENLYVTFSVTVLDLDDEITDIDFAFTLEDEPIEPLPTTFTTVNPPAYEQLVEFEFLHSDLCARGEPSSRDQLRVEMIARDADGNAIESDSARLNIRSEFPDLTLDYDLEFTEWVAVDSPFYNPTAYSPPIVIAEIAAQDTLVLTGIGTLCGEDGSDQSDGLRWWDQETGELLSDSYVVGLSTPDEFTDEDGGRRDRLLRLDHQSLDGEIDVLVAACEPYCVDPTYLDEEISHRFFDPMLRCSDGSFDPDCAFRSIDELFNSLEDRINGHLFEGLTPEVGFPLTSLEQWDQSTSFGEESLLAAEQLSHVAMDHPELADGEFLPFIFTARQVVREFQGSRTEIEGLLFNDFMTTLSVGLQLFGAPTHGGWNAARYFGYALDDPDPATIHEAIDFRYAVGTAILGAGSLISSRYAEDPLTLREKLPSAVAYGFVHGVWEQAAELQPRDR